jgi:phosphotransferase family enzyme
LGFLGVPSSAAEGFKGEVEAAARRMPAFGCADEPLLSRALTALRASTPSGGRLALCHGDPNPFNYLFRGQQLVGVVDWEQALISDPRSDIGQLVSLSHLRGAAPYGPPSENLFVQLYEASTGERLESMELFRARWLFQLGVVYHGWPTERNRGSPGRRSRTSLPALSRSCDVSARQDAGFYLKTELERELSKLVLNCMACGIEVHWVSGLS